MATPKWIESESRWRLDVVHEGQRRVFTSSKPGRPGKTKVTRDYNAWINGMDLNKTVKQAWAGYLDDVKARTSPEQYTNIESIGRLYVLPRCGGRKVASMRVANWQEIINTARPAGIDIKRKDGTTKHFVRTAELSKKSLSNIVVAIGAFTRYCVRAGFLDAPVTGLYVPKSAPSGEKMILQPDALKKLFEPSDEWYINAWRLMAVTGLRPGEVYGLKWQDIQNGTMTLSRARNDFGRETEGKNKNARRQIALHRVASSILDDQKEKTARLESEWVFCNRIGSLQRPGSLRTVWHRYAGRLGIDKKVTPYSLRHTFISMAKNDLPEQMLKAIVGHSVAMDTFGTYGHDVAGEKQQAAKILDITFERVLKTESGQTN